MARNVYEIILFFDFFSKLTKLFLLRLHQKWVEDICICICTFLQILLLFTGFICVYFSFLYITGSVGKFLVLLYTRILCFYLHTILQNLYTMLLIQFRVQYKLGTLMCHKRHFPQNFDQKASEVNRMGRLCTCTCTYI